MAKPSRGWLLRCPSCGNVHVMYVKPVGAMCSCGRPYEISEMERSQADEIHRRWMDGERE